MSKPLCVLMLLALPLLCLAEGKGLVNERPIVADKLDGFEHEAAAVRQGMQPGGIYSYIKDDERVRVEKRLDDMHALLQTHAGEAELSQTDKVTLLNEQEELNAVLLQNDNNRLECERGAHTGSRIHVTSCQTHGELMERQRRDQGVLGDIQRQSQTQLPSKDH